jgi:hypothetical protein
MYTHQEALEKPLVAPSGFLTAGCGSHAAAEKQVNTTARGFREILKIPT